jgi:hypothetical protein
MKNSKKNIADFENKKISETLQKMNVGSVEDFLSKKSQSVRQTIYNLQQRYLDEGRKWETKKIGYLLMVKRVK